MAKSQAKISLLTDEDIRAEIARLRALESWTAVDVASFLLEPGKGETQYADPQRKGLIHCIYKNGSRLWRYRYKPKGGKRQAIEYGAYGTPSRIIVSYERAKDRWADDNAVFRKGGDPKPKKAEPEAAKEEHTLRQLVTLWTETSYADKGLDGLKSKAKRLEALEGNISDKLWDTVTSEIGVPHINAVLDPMKKRGAFEYARKVWSYLRLLSKFALTRDIPFDPVIFLKIPRPARDARKEVKVFKCGPKVKVLTSEQVAIMWHDISGAVDTPYIWHLNALQLVLGQRQCEINGIMKEHVDRKNRLLTIPWENLKTRYLTPNKTMEEMMKPHILWLPDIAMDIINDAWRMTDGNRGPLFPAAKTREPVTTHDVNGWLREIATDNRMPGVPRFATHANRRFMITEGRKVENKAKLGEAAQYMHHVLGHVDGEENEAEVKHGGNAITDESYDMNQYMAEKRIVLEAWGAFIDDLVGHSASKKLRLVA